LARVLLLALAAAAAAPPVHAQRRFPPDSLVNTRIFARGTPVTTVIGTMRNITGWLGVRCQYCHIGEEGLPLDSFDFASDDKRTKQTARLMMDMVREVNRRLGDVPGRPQPALEVTCGTCHRGVARPVPLLDLLTQANAAAGLDSAVTLYRALRGRYYGAAAYDFSEVALNVLAGRLQRAGQFDGALRVVALNAEFWPDRPGVAVTRGEVLLARGDTAAAIVEYQRALTLGPDLQARQRLQLLQRGGARP
jgi:hypothetical protein